MVRIPPDPVYTFRKNMGQINCLLLVTENNSELLYVGTAEGILHIWDLKIKREIRNVKVCDKECLAIARWHDKFIVQERGECLKYWRVEDLGWHLVLTIAIDYFGFCKCTVFNDYVYCPCSGGVVRVFQETREKMVCDPTIKDKGNERGEVMCMKFLRQSHSLLVAYESGVLSLWSLHDNVPKIKSERKFVDTPMCIDYCELTAEGILGTSGDSLKKFSISNNIINEIHSTTLTNPGIASAALNNDGKLVAAGCWDGKIRYFSMKHLKLLAVLDHHSGGAVMCVQFSEHVLTSCSLGSLFAAGSDGRISLWDLYTKRKI